MYCRLPAPGAAGSLGAQSAIVIDTVAPLLQGVRAAVPNGTYAAGQRILVNASFNEAVVVNGSQAPSLTLNVGGANRAAEYLRGNNSNTITFGYTVLASDGTASLDYNATNAMTGPITDAAGNAADLTLPSPGAPGSLADTSDIILRALVRAAYESSMSSGSSTNLHGVAVGPDGSVYVARYITHNILVFDSSGSYVSAIPGAPASASSAPGEFNQPVGVAVNRTGHIFAVDLQNDRIQVFHPNGTFASAIAVQGAGLIYPHDIGTDAAGHIYVLDRNAHHVRVLGPDGATVRTIGSQGSGDGQVDTPHGMAIGPSGLVYVTDSNNHRVQVFHPNGTPAFRFGAQGSGPGQLGAPYDVEVGPSGLVFVSERHNDRISVFRSNGSFVLSFGSAGTGAGQFGELTGVAADPSGRILAADWTRSDVQVFRLAHAGAPNVTSVSVRQGTAPPGGVLGGGASVDIDVAFDADIYVNTTLSTPALLLEAGGTDRQARYTGYSGPALSFRYTAQDGDGTDRLSYAWEGALHPNGSSIASGQGAGAAPASLRLPAPGSAGSLSDPARGSVAVDTVRPYILNVTSTDDDGTHGTGATINITIRFSEGVEFVPSSARPRFDLDTGNADAANRHAVCTPDEFASAELDCTYTVRRGDATADLGYGAGTPLVFGVGAAATDEAGNALLAVLPDSPAAATLGGSKEIALDTSVPEMLRVTSPNASGTYGRGDTIRVNVVFDGDVTIDPEPAAGSPSAPVLRLETGEIDRTALYAGGSGTRTLEFEYTVIAGDFSADLNYTGTGALLLGSGARLVDEHGNEEQNPPALPDPASGNSLGGQKDIEVRTVPTVDRVSLNRTDAVLKVGQTLGVRVQFSEKVDVGGGAPYIGLDTGRAAEGRAAYSSGSGTPALVFAYPVHHEDSKAMLDYNGTDALRLNGATIRGAGEAANLTLPAPGSAGSLASAGIELRPNEPPAIDPPGNHSVGAGVTLREGITARDPEGQPVAFSLVAPAPAGAAIDASTGLFTWTPTEQQRTARGPANSTYVITVRASDPHMASDTARFAVTVIEAPPQGYEGPSIGAIPDMTGKEGEAIRFVVNASGNGALVYSLAVEADPRPPAGAAVHPNGTFSWVPGHDQNGTHPITVRVADRFGLDDTGAFTITVLDAEPPWNEPPVIDPIGPRNADEGGRLEVRVSAADPDGPVAYSLAGEPPAGAAIDPATGVFSWDIGYDQAGTHNITVSAADRYNRTSGISFAVTVADVDPPNLPPAIAPMPAQRVTAGSALVLQVNATDPNEGDTLTFGLVDPPPGAAITAGGLLTWTPGRGQVGLHSLNVTVADDGGLEGSALLGVTVVDPTAAAASAEAVFAGPATVRIDYTAPLGPPAGHTGAVYGNVSIGEGGSAAPAGVSGLGTHTHTVRLDGDVVAGSGQNGTIRLLADLEGAVNGTLYAFTNDSIPVRAGEEARTLSPPGAAAPVVAIESDGFVRAVDATAAGDGARPAINVSGLPAPDGDPAQGSGAVKMPDDNVTIVASFASVSFPPNVVATSVPAGGLLGLYVSPRPPTAQEVADGFGVPVGGVEVLLVVEVGDNATRIEFDMPVRILLAGQANGSAFYVNGTGGGGGGPAVVPIAAECNAGDTFAAAHARLGGSGECWLDSGADKVIYTYHLTQFGAADIPPAMCAAGLESDAVEFGPVAAGGQSDAKSQRITSAGALPLAAVSVSATDWTREGAAAATGAAMPANATQVRAGGAGEWKPLEGSLPVALGTDGQYASVQFRLAVPADALGGGASAVSVSQTVTYTVECAAPDG